MGRGRGQVRDERGVAKGNISRARHVGPDIVAGLRNIVGGEVVEYTKLMAEARGQRLDRMIENASAMGADAVTGKRMTTSMIAHGAAEILACGTAVKLDLPAAPANSFRRALPADNGALAQLCERARAPAC